MFEKIKNYEKRIISIFTHLKDLRVVGLLLFLVIVLLVSWSSVRAIETNYDLQKQIAALRQENAVKKISNENLKLENKYLETPQFLEIAARQDFGLAAKGEAVLTVPRAVALSYTVDLPSANEPTQESNDKQPAYQRHFQAWMDFLFHRNNND